ncbi:hypothetical protein Tco_1368985 [Tanacetum coccineum]
MAHFVVVGDFGIGYWYDGKEIEFCDDGVDGFDAFSYWYDGLELRSSSSVSAGYIIEFMLEDLEAVPADYVPAGHVLISADRYRIC